MIQLIRRSERNLSPVEIKQMLLSGNLRDATYCAYCLIRISDINRAVYQNDEMFCCPDHAREFRIDGLVTKRSKNAEEL